MGTKDLIVLGVFDGHNSGACLLKNGKIISAISEERLTRLKNDSGYPKNSVEKVLGYSGLTSEDIDIIALAGKFSHDKQFYLGGWDWYKVGHKDQLKNDKEKHFKRLEQRIPERKNQIIKHLNVSENKIIVVEHHLAHAACAYYGSSWV